MLVAKTDEAHERVGRDVPPPRRRTTVPGARPRRAWNTTSFAVDAPLGRHAARVVVDATGGRPAATRFEVRERPGRVTLAGGRAAGPAARIRSGCT